MKSSNFVCALCFCLLALLLFNGCAGNGNSGAKAGQDKIGAAQASAGPATSSTVSYAKLEKQFVLMDAKAQEYYQNGAAEQKAAHYQNAVKDYQKARAIYMQLFEWYGSVKNAEKTGVYQAYVKDCNDRLSELQTV